VDLLPFGTAGFAEGTSSGCSYTYDFRENVFTGADWQKVVAISFPFFYPFFEVL
jgi:hypothetical protein